MYGIMFNRLSTQTLFLAAFFAVLAGCAGSGETAVVTERPEPATPRPGTSAPGSAPAEPIALTSMPAGFDTVAAQRFDAGKMWTFDNPPTAYFTQAYNFTPDEAWFQKARSGALRFASYCSASFVSPNGLILTNHHCGRESVTAVSKPGENLLENGFYAETLEQERKVKDLYVDQLVSITDVTNEVYSSSGKSADAAARAEAVSNAVTRIQERMTSEAKTRDTTYHVQVIELYNGGKYSAYTFKRYNDIRLVMAPEVELGFFGGDPDNFTYPRYALDMSFFRAYDVQGKPLTTPEYFPWSDNGAAEGETVFVIGNPGSTSRLNTISQLEFERDYTLPAELEVLRDRARILMDFIEANPEEAEKYDLRNAYFSISNSIKANQGQLEGLQDPYLIARRAASERALQTAIAGADSLDSQYGKLIDQIKDLQRTKSATLNQSNAFIGFGSDQIGSHILLRALYGYIYSILKQRGAPQERLTSIKKEALKVTDRPSPVEKGFITSRLRSLQNALGVTDPTLRRVLQGRTPEEVADEIVEKTALADSASFAGLLEKGFMSSDDVTVGVIDALAPLYFTVSQQVDDVQAREKSLNASLARARFAVYGTQVPPDASFSLRLADGVVLGYPYNGTIAPPHTTFYGLYDAYYSYQKEDWDLPARWIERRNRLKLSTPFNLVSTNDITGGNSGSPLVNKNLEIVGLVFDGNIESLPNNYLFRSIVERAVSVDSRGILESLRSVYDADRLVREIESGSLASQ